MNSNLKARLWSPVLLALALFSGGNHLFGQDRVVSKWIEVPFPTNTSSAEIMLWKYSGDSSSHDWRVFREGATVCAELAANSNSTSREKPGFKIADDGLLGSPSSSWRVEDGWLLGFNRGEWGGALYWFNEDGSRNYKISDHQIVDFFRQGTNILAIEGMSHLSVSRGSVIRVSRSAKDGPWRAETLHKLPQAPFAVTPGQQGTLFIALQNSLVSLAADGGLKTIAKESRWSWFLPNSIALSADSKKAFIGMRQFVAEISLSNGKFRFLIPDRSFLNQLPKAEEDRVRRMYRE